MEIKTHGPRIKIVVRKNIFRIDGVSQRKANQPDVIDITRFLGDLGSVSISKSIYAPMGSFAITLADRAIDNLDSLYGLIEALDYVEIAFARNPHEYTALPVVMRGFVRSITRKEAMGANGRPSRVVMIEGNDFGLVFDLYRLYRMRNYVQGELLLTRFQRNVLVGLEYRPMRADDYMRQFVEHINETYLPNIFHNYEGDSNQIKHRLSVTSSQIFPTDLNTHTGPLWAHMIREADTPWNELYIQDFSDGPTLVYRAAPWVDAETGKFTAERDDVWADMNEISASDVVAMEAHRDDYRIFNIFWVQLAWDYLGWNSKGLSAAFLADREDVYVRDVKNCDPKIYGDRLLEQETRHGPIELLHHPINLPKTEQQQSYSLYTTFVEDRRRELIRMNKDNVALEHGTMNLKGNERIRAGNYIRLRRGEFLIDYYAHSVAHNFSPLRQFTTSVQFIRGTGFLVRNKSQRPPHLAERMKTEVPGA